MNTPIIIILIVAAVLLISQFVQNRQSKKGLQAKDINGSDMRNNNLERKLVPNGSKQAIEVQKADDIMNVIDETENFIE